MSGNPGGPEGYTFEPGYPHEDKKLTVLRLDGTGVVAGIEFIDPEKGLPALFAP